MISLKTQIEALKVRIGDYEQDIKKTEDRLEKERAESAKTAADLHAERGKVENLGQRIGTLEQQLAAQKTESEWLGKRAAELDTRIAEQGRLLVQREYDCERLKAELENARRTGFHLREEIASSSSQLKETVRNLTAEKDVLQQELGVAIAERSKLQLELGAMKREAESTWAAERVENALLRERINDVAAEVVKLAVTLEGPNSPIEAILAAETVPVRKGTKGTVQATTSDDAKRNLADRMRALQNHASRLAPQS
jgi:chromosome segregation ATPase